MLRTSVQDRAAGEHDAGETRADEPRVAASPAELGEALLWLRADQGAEFDSEGSLVAWRSQGDGAYTAMPPLPEQAPRRVEAAGGRTWLDFDGGDELVLPTLPPVSEFSFFAVAAAQQASGGQRCNSLLHLANRVAGTVTQTARIEIGRHMSELLYQVDRVEVTPAAGSGLFPTTSPHVLSVTHRADKTARVYVDGRGVRELTDVDLPEAVERAFNYIGHNHYHFNAEVTQCDPFNGQLGELILFTRGVTEDDRYEIERYLHAKWRVPR